MNPFVAYLLKATLISGVMYGYYFWFLKDNRFHRWNRFYLLASVVLALVLPLVFVPVHPPADNHRFVYDFLAVLGRASGDSQASGTVAGAPVGSFWSWALALTGGYVLVAVLLAVGFCLELRRVASLCWRGARHRFQDVILVETVDRAAPFSFFHWVFWNPSIDPGSVQGQQVLRHELTHVRQGHSWDLLVLKLVGIVFFPVLFFHYIRKELQLIHEYLADQNATSDSDALDYAGLLLQQAMGATTYSFANHFYKHPLQRRIAMMNKFSLPSFTYLRKVMLLPLTLGLFALVAFRVDHTERRLIAPNGARSFFAADTTPGSATNDSILVVVDGKVLGQLNARQMIQKLDPNEILSMNVLKDEAAIKAYGNEGRFGVIEIVTKNASQDLIDKVRLQNANEDDLVFTKVEIEAQFPGGQDKWNEYVKNTIMRHIDELQKDGKSGTCQIQFVVDAHGKVSDVEAVTMEGTKLADVCVNAIKSGPDWIPARENGRNVKAFRHQMITFQMPTR